MFLHLDVKENVVRKPSGPRIDSPITFRDTKITLVKSGYTQAGNTSADILQDNCEH